MTAPSEGVRGLLTTHVGTSGWELHTGRMPLSPDKVIMVSDSGGPPSNPRDLLDFPNVSIMVRGTTGGYLAARTEAVAVKDILLGLPSQDIGGDRWVSVTLLSDVAYLGVDENERPLFSVNFSLIIEPAASAETNRTAL